MSIVAYSPLRAKHISVSSHQKVVFETSLLIIFFMPKHNFIGNSDSSAISVDPFNNDSATSKKGVAGLGGPKPTEDGCNRHQSICLAVFFRPQHSIALFFGRWCVGGVPLPVSPVGRSANGWLISCGQLKTLQTYSPHNAGSPKRLTDARPKKATIPLPKSF